MTPPSVLLERTFVAALLDPDDDAHPAASARYAALVEQYAAHEVRLRARHDHVEGIDRDRRRSLLAPVERIRVAGQHRRQAARLTLPFEASTDVAITLVVMRRERIDRIATLDPVFDRIDLTILR